MQPSEQRVKIALQKSGRLTDCGIKFSKSRDQLFCFGENMPVDLLLVRDDDIPSLVGDDICDLGIVGLNVVEEKRHDIEANGREVRFDLLRTLDFGHCRLVIAAPDNREFHDLACLQNTRIATSYPGLLSDFLRREDIDAEIVYLSGAVEITPRLGKADFICDLVSTGATLAANQLRENYTVLESQASVIMTRADIDPFKREWIEKISQRLDGILQVPDPRLPKSPDYYPAPKHRPSSLLTAVTKESQCTRCAAKTCFGKPSKALRVPAPAPCWCFPSRRCWPE
jgi:ATP phosphoribosyltransferase